MSEYLQAFLDETDEELENLVQALLKLEEDPHDETSLNEAFRMLHSMKGSSGMMGYEGVAELTHHLETRFDEFRAGTSELNQTVMDLILNCVDFLRAFAVDLRAGKDVNQDGSKLIAQLNQPSAQVDEAAIDETDPMRLATVSGGIRVRVQFRKGLQLADLKARLIMARLANIGEIIDSDPPIDDVQSFDDLPQFTVILATERPPEEIRSIANVDGVESVEIVGSPVAAEVNANDSFATDSNATSPPAQNDQNEIVEEFPDNAASTADDVAVVEDDSTLDTTASIQNVESKPSDAVATLKAPVVAGEPAEPVKNDGAHRVAETVRVEIDRLDRLMNLTGELVVTNARFNQIASELSPALKSARNVRLTDLVERMQLAVENLASRIPAQEEDDSFATNSLLELREDLLTFSEQSALWEEGRRHFSQLHDAVDQLSRVSRNLQQGVLDTRMVPVGPLFGRFKRVIRDLTRDSDKRVELVIRGEKTELDKRMIDELGDPLLHLIRNAIDHGLESTSDRKRAGKPESGVVTLEASHSGNNVFVSIRDDGAGVDVEKVRARAIERELVEPTFAQQMTEQQVLELIWHPGFSTADHVTDISGRGVGMDIVKNRINELNGSIEVTTEPGRGTRFLLRLPLTLAIIRSLMIRIGEGFFSVPIDDVREIVSIAPEQIYSVHGHQTIEVRGDFIPLKSLGDLLEWRDAENSRLAESASLNVVILHSRGKTLGLCVDELLGGADIVIKSLADNFLSIRGLSGASIMGDGSICLMLDTATLLEIV